MKTFPKLLISSIAFAAAASASADVVIDPMVTVNLSNWTYGAGHGVNVGAPTWAGDAGGFKGVLSNAGAYDNASFETYCVQLTQDFHWNTTYNDYKIIDGSTYSLFTYNPGTVAKIGQLMTYVDTLAPLTSTQSTGLQMAIWELVYEDPLTTGGYTLDSGIFKNTPGTSNTFGNSLLSSFSTTTSLYKVDVLANDNRQDFLILTAVPEPEGYALAFAGLAMVGLFGRKFRAAKQA